MRSWRIFYVFNLQETKLLANFRIRCKEIRSFSNRRSDNCYLIRGVEIKLECFEVEFFITESLNFGGTWESVFLICKSTVTTFSVVL